MVVRLLFYPPSILPICSLLVLPYPLKPNPSAGRRQALSTAGAAGPGRSPSRLARQRAAGAARCRAAHAAEGSGCHVRQGSGTGARALAWEGHERGRGGTGACLLRAGGAAEPPHAPRVGGAAAPGAPRGERLRGSATSLAWVRFALIWCDLLQFMVDERPAWLPGG